MKFFLIALTLISASASASHAASMGCVSLEDDSALPVFTVERIENVLAYRSNAGIYGIVVNALSGGEQDEEAIVNDDGTTTFTANNGCDTDFKFSFQSSDLSVFLGRALLSMEGTVTFDDLTVEPVIYRTEKIRCTYLP